MERLGGYAEAHSLLLSTDEPGSARHSAESSVDLTCRSSRWQPMATGGNLRRPPVIGGNQW